jgi:hypothetical protein
MTSLIYWIGTVVRSFFYFSVFLLTALVTQVHAQWRISPGYNSFHEINDRGELADLGLNIGRSSEPERFNEINIKTLADLGSPGRSDRYKNPTGLPDAQQGLNGYTVRYLNDGRLLLNHRIIRSELRIEDQFPSGTGVFQNGSVSRLDSGSRSVVGTDMNEAGWVVGYREKTGLGHEFRIPGVTAVPIAISPSGAVSEIAHPNGQPYGIGQEGEPFFRVNRDNCAILTAINASGMAAGAGHEFLRDNPGAHDVSNFSFYVSLPGGTPVKIPHPSGFGFIGGGASDINDLGEIVGMWGAQTWIYLPSSNYGLSSGTHFIRDEWMSSGYRAEWDQQAYYTRKDVRINNRGMVIWSSTYTAEDSYSTTIWDRGSLKDVNTLNPNPGNPIIGVVDLNERNELLVFTNDRRTRVLSPTALSLELDPQRPVFDVEEVSVLTIRLDHVDSTPASYRFLEPIVNDSAFLLEYPQPTLSGPILLGGETSSWTTSIPVKMLKPGVTEISVKVEITPQGGEPREEIATLDVVINPLTLTVNISPVEYLLNQTPESKWGTRAQQVNEALRNANAPPYRNLLEIELVIKNDANAPVSNVTVPSAGELFSLVSSTDPEKPGVPLNRILFFKPDDTVHDYANPESNPEFQPLSLLPGESKTLAWVVEPYDANPDPLIDNSADLEFQPVVLANFLEKTVQDSLEVPFVIIDQPLLKWGVRPKDGRTNYLSGTPVRVTGFLENVSAENSNEGRDLVAVIYPLQEGNLGGGFLKDVKSPEAGFPDYYEVFELPYEGENKRIDLTGLFVTMPSDERKEGKVAYGVKVWILEEDGAATASHSQAVVATDWDSSFAVVLEGNPPLLSDAAQRRAECEQLGIWPFLCGVEEGSLEFAQGVHGLYQILLATDEGVRNLWRGAIAYELLAAKAMFDAVRGEPDAWDALWADSYEKYKRFHEFGILAGQAVGQAPLVFEAFSTQMGDAMVNFFSAVENGNLSEVQFQVGKFLGANPDILLEPLAVGAAYTKMARRLQKEVTGDAISVARKLERERQQASLVQRIADGKSNPDISDLTTVLRPGDKLDADQLFELYGVDAEQLELVQRIARRNGVVITFRARNPISRDLIRSGRAWPKPQFVKMKNVNEIDVKYLDYPEDVFGTVDIMEPPPSLINKTGKELETALSAYMTELKKVKPDLASNDVLAGEVRSRLKLRTEEWNKYIPEFKVKDGDSSVIGGTSFEEELQFTPGKVQDRVEKLGVKESRRFETYPDDAVIDPVSKQPRRRWLLAMSDPTGKDLRRITGDIDFMALLEPNGGMIRDPDKRMKIYKQLAEELDMQHGESFTFFLQDARLKYLKDHIPGGEAMISILPHGPQTPTATFFSDALSIMEGSANTAFLPSRQVVKKPDQWVLKEGELILQEGKELVMRRPDPTGEYIALMGLEATSKMDLDFVNRFKVNILRHSMEVLRKRIHFIWPRHLLHRVGQEASDVEFKKKLLPQSSAEGFFRQLEAEPSYPLMQLSFDGEDGTSRLKVWEEGIGWRSVSEAEAVALGDPGILDMLPMSAILQSTAPGDRVLEIVPQAELEVEGAFFDRGDRVVINPGAENEEFATVVRSNPLTLADGLVYSHASSELIASLGPDETDRDADGLNGFEEVNLGTSPESFDTDGDGLGDGDEIALWSDPLDPSSGMDLLTHPLPETGNGFWLSWRASQGQRYQLESSEALSPAHWQSLGPVIATNSVMALDLSSVIPETGNRFFRVVAQPRNDIDLDGLTLREEIAYGTNPALADSDGDGFSDAEEVYMETDPMDPDSLLEIIDITVRPEDGATEIRFNSAIGIRYLIEVAAGPDWLEIDRITADSGLTAVTIPAEVLVSTDRSFRVRPLLP